MMKPSPQLIRVILLIAILTCVLLPFYNINWQLVLLFFVLFGLIGNGVVGHRLVCHRQFEVARWLRHPLYLLTTLGGYAPVWYWRIQHWHHHKHSDQPQDIHSPQTHDFWTSFFGWSMRQDFVNSVIKSERRLLVESLRDSYMAPYFKHTYKILWAFLIALLLINPAVLLAYCIYYWIEITRLGLTASLAHMKAPLSYRNYDTDDHSQNNYLIGYLSFGLGWHNNHHAMPRRLDNRVRWWEFDIEAQLGKFLQAIPGAR